VQHIKASGYEDFFFHQKKCSEYSDFLDKGSTIFLSQNKEKALHNPHKPISKLIYISLSAYLFIFWEIFGLCKLACNAIVRNKKPLASPPIYGNG
jgi:hypothetical protein